MPKLVPQQLLFILTLFVVCNHCAMNTVRADFALFDYYGFSLGQYSADGQYVKPFGRSNIPGSIFEETWDHVSYSRDLAYSFYFGNTFGNLTIYPFDRVTGDYIGPYDEHDDGSGSNVYRWYYSPFIRDLPDGHYHFSSDADAIGDEFHIVGYRDDLIGPELPVIISFKRAEPLWDVLATTPFLPGKYIWKFQVLPSGQFLVLSDGIYIGDTNGFTQLIAPNAGERYYAYDFAISPDNLIYIMDPGSAEIRRYDQTGNFLGIFLHPDDLDMELQSMQFGPNGDLYVLGAQPVPNKAPLPIIKCDSPRLSDSGGPVFYAAITGAFSASNCSGVL